MQGFNTEFLTAFSSDTKEASIKSVENYVNEINPWNINFDTLESKVDPILLRDMGTMIDIGAENELHADSDDEVVDRLFEKNLKGIVSDIFEERILTSVVLISLIRKDLLYNDNKNINEKLLKELFHQDCTDALLHIRYSLFVKRLKYFEKLKEEKRFE